MARVAIVCGRQSLVVFAAFTADTAHRAAMARHAIANERGVIHRRRGPRYLRMADRTLFGRRQVRGALAARQHVVMAGVARSDRCLRVIETHNRRPVGRRLGMACIAVIRRGQALLVLS